MSSCWVKKTTTLCRVPFSTLKLITFQQQHIPKCPWKRYQWSRPLPCPARCPTSGWNDRHLESTRSWRRRLYVNLINKHLDQGWENWVPWAMVWVQVFWLSSQSASNTAVMGEVFNSCWKIGHSKNLYPHTSPPWLELLTPDLYTGKMAVDCSWHDGSATTAQGLKYHGHSCI